ncbi:MAG: tetratricopeptide repeat protein [Sphingomonadales bacterium]|jgi:Flp pilus assembly protein TadD/cell division protein FtsN
MTHPAKFIVLGFALLALGACATENRLEELPPANQKQTQEDPAALIRLGDRMRLAGNYGAAANFYNRVLTQQPNNIEVLNHLGDMAWQNRVWQEAAGYYGQVLSIDPENASALAGRARILIAQGDSFGALDLINRLESSGGASLESLYTRAIANDMLGRQQTAQILYREALAEEPSDPRLNNSLALSLAISEDYGGALRVLRQMSDASPNSEEVRQSLALVYALSGQVDTAVELADRISPGQNLRVFFSRLTGLTPAQKAEAVYFRRLPTLQQQMAQASAVEAEKEEVPVLMPKQPKVVSVPPEMLEEEAEPSVEESVAAAQPEPIMEEAEVQEDLPQAEEPAYQEDLAQPDIIETGGYFVQLGSFRRVEAIHLAWAQVKAKSNFAGQNHLPRVQTIETEDRGTFLRVVLGPFEEKFDAETNCDALKQDDVECLVVFNRLPARTLANLQD